MISGTKVVTAKNRTNHSHNVPSFHHNHTLIFSHHSPTSMMQSQNIYFKYTLQIFKKKLHPTLHPLQSIPNPIHDPPSRLRRSRLPLSPRPRRMNQRAPAIRIHDGHLEVPRDSIVLLLDEFEYVPEFALEELTKGTAVRTVPSSAAVLDLDG